MGNAAAIGREIRADLSKIIRDVMTLACMNLRDATPVDTTNAANNWIITFGSPYSGTDGSRESPSHAMQDASLERMATYDVGRDGKVYIRNNVLYVQHLDQGYSQQAEPGFVAKCFAAAVRRAPYGRKGSARKLLKSMARTAYLKTY